jgi:hypothetical protein
MSSNFSDGNRLMRQRKILTAFEQFVDAQLEQKKSVVERFVVFVLLLTV